MSPDQAASFKEMVRTMLRSYRGGLLDDRRHLLPNSSGSYTSRGRWSAWGRWARGTGSC